jgi:hypothetical protein
MQLFKDEISKKMYAARMKQVGGYMALGLASVAATHDVSWITTISEQSQDLISKVGLASAIGISVGTGGYAALHELSEFVARKDERKIEKTLGAQAFEIQDKADKMANVVDVETSNRVVIEQKESMQTLLDKGLEAKRKSLDDIIPTLDEIIVPEPVVATITEIEPEVVVQNKEPKAPEIQEDEAAFQTKALPKSVLDKLADSMDDFNEKPVEKVAIVEETPQIETTKKALSSYILDKLVDTEEELFEPKSNRIEPTIRTLIEDVKEVGAKIEPVIKKEEKPLEIKNTEIEMNLKKDLPLITLFNKKKSSAELSIKNKNSIQNAIA